ncbi:MAG: T9SS type A sorting domain-containing protein [Bacteroides sp.]|jgi:hypothetical protein|nr:T9SS type A sorting domain-containing protein [Bacteroides sp.]
MKKILRNYVGVLLSCLLFLSTGLMAQTFEEPHAGQSLSTSGLVSSSPEGLYRSSLTNLTGTNSELQSLMKNAETVVYEPSGLCDENVPFIVVDLSDQPDGSYYLTDDFRSGLCCGIEGGGNRCFEVLLILSDQTAAVSIDLAGATATGAADWWLTPLPLADGTCANPSYKIGDQVCVSEGGIYALTFCKPGQNTYELVINAYSKPTIPDFEVRQDCSTQLEVFGFQESSVTWSGDFVSSLDFSTGLDSPTFTWSEGMPLYPGYVEFNVCGNVTAAESCIGFGGEYCETTRVYVYPEMLIEVSPVSPLFCEGSGVELTANVSGGKPPYTLQWINPLGEVAGTGESVFADIAGQWSFIVADALTTDGCPPAETLVMVEEVSLSLSGLVENVACFGGNDGSILAEVSGGYAPYQYAWSHDMALSGPEATNLMAGEYTLTVTDVNGCSAEYTFMVEEPEAALEALINQVQDESCYGAGDGAAGINVLGGTPPYTLIITDGNGQPVMLDGTPEKMVSATSRIRNNEASRNRNSLSMEELLLKAMAVTGDYTASNLVPGTYLVSLTDANGCEFEVSFTIEAGPMMEAEIVADGDLEFCEGSSVELTATEGASYLWSTGATAQSIVVSESGTYNVEVTFDNGCIANASVEVIVNEVPEVSLSALTGLCQDAAPVSLGGGMPEGGVYSGTGVVDGMFDPAIAGVGTFEITYTYTDENGCSNFATASITVYEQPEVSLASFEAVCEDVPAFVLSGGMPEGGVYSGTGVADGMFDPALAGNGTFEITYTYTDANGCSNYATASITVNELPEVTLASFEALCEDVPAFALAGGMPEGGVYSGTGVADGMFDPAVSGTGTFEITYTYTDENGCSNFATAFITVNELPEVSLSAFNSLCQNAAAFALSGGMPEGGVYSGTGVVDGMFDPAVAGIGTFEITYTYTDENGCSNFATASITVYEQPEVSLASFEAVCEDVPAFVLTGGMPEGGVYSGTGVADGMFDPAVAGNGTFEITYTYTDANGCSNFATANITVNELPVVTLAPFEDVCEHGPAFELTGGMPEGGVYSGPGVENGMFDPTAVGAGTWEITYTYTDENGCSNFATATIYVKTMYAFYEVVNASCFGAEDGAIYLEVHNGNGTYTFLWSNGATTQNLENIPAGEYSVEISDGINCMLYVSGIVVEQPTEIIIEGVVNQISAYGETDGSISTSVSGGNPPYTYAWSNGETTPDLTDLGPGTYVLTVTDADNCQAVAEFVIAEPEILVDLQVTIEVNIATPDPDVVDELIFAVVVTNLNQNIDATGVSVENILPDVFPYIIRLDEGTHGSYDPNTGIWTIGTIPAGEYAMLVYRTGMLLSEAIPSAVNAAEIMPFDQEDPNLDNNYDEVVVTIGESTGGDDGGIESDGNMASQIALRNHKRLVESRHIAQENRVKEMPAFQISDMLTGAINTATLDGTPSTGISYFIPEQGPAETHAYISTPADLLAITNANEIFAVDYLQQDNSRRAAILAIATDPGTVYDHTKVICDRLTGASLEELRHIQIAGQPFILSKLVHPNGYVDYAVSFIATWRNNGFTIDNRWYNGLYNPNGTEEVFNFQVWSVTPQFTRELVETILESMSNTGSLTFRNAITEPQIPQVYVRNGQYRNGKLMLNLVNTNGASSITLTGNKAVVENGNRESFQIEVSIPTSGTSSVEIPVGYLFDAGFSIANNKDNTRDVLYYADGPWMFDYDPGNSVVTHFSTEPETGVLHDRSYNIERDATIKGSVRTYASLFRRLGPGTQPMDMTQYDQVVFNASGVGTVEVMIAKASIHAWNEQYRTVITLNPEEQQYRINFSDLKTAEGQKGFTADDIISVIFNPIGNGSQASPFEVNISNLHFTNHLIEENAAGIFYTSYPNPFKSTTTMEFVLKNESQVKVEIMNLYGQTLEVLKDETMPAGANRVDWTPQALKSGIYMFRITIGNETYSGKMIYQP